MKSISSIDKPRHIWWKLRPHIDYGTVEFRMCDVQRSLKNTFTLVALAQALVRTIHINDDYNNSKYNHDILDDGLWRASRSGINCNIIDPLTNKALSMKEMIYLMIEYCKDSLVHFNSYEKVITSIENILTNGTESDLQIKYFKKNGFDGLMKHLIEDVEL